MCFKEDEKKAYESLGRQSKISIQTSKEWMQF